MVKRILAGTTGKAGGQEGSGALVLPISSGSQSTTYLVDLFRRIRPDDHADIRQAETNFQSVLYQLQQDRSFLFSLRRAILTQFQHTRIVPALTESGIVTSRGFIQELLKKLQRKMLPELQDPDDFLYTLNRVFFDKGDHVWVEGIDPSLWAAFFDTLGIQVNLAEPWLIRELNTALQVLSVRLSSLGLEKEVRQPMDAENSASYPFMEQGRLVSLYMEMQAENRPTADSATLLNNISESLHNCRQSIQWIRNRRTDQGTSLAQTYLLVLMEQQIHRMFIIVDILDKGNDFQTGRFVQYFTMLVRNENRKNSLREFLSQTFSLLAYQIAEHKGKKGRHYITRTPAEYVKLFRSSMAGGFIVSFVAIFKNLLGLLPFPPFWQGLAYSINYSAGFVLMDLTGATLATKQPAYTASTVAQSLDPRKQGGQPDLRNLAVTVAGIVRSQTASFAGNLLVVFPLAYVLAWGYHALTGVKIAEGPAADQLLLNQHPWKSLSLLYACVTGFFLFLSGLIAGYVENQVIYGRIPERLVAHPYLGATMHAGRLEKLAGFIRRMAGPLTGSIALGFFLGTAGPLGKILAIPLDIRHITISAGNIGIALYGMDHLVPLGYLLTVVAGTLMIGFLNFFVSFSLAFSVAIRSRRIDLREYKAFLGILWSYFRKYPADFLRPPKMPRSPDQIPG
jgi:site-specific recombinase